MAPVDKAVVLLSGGIDSAVSLWWARARGWDLRPLTFHYFRRPPQEIVATRKLIELSGLSRLQEIDLPFLQEVDDMKKGIENPVLAESPEGYIPARNMVFYAVAGFYAEPIGARWVIGGHNGTDPEAFPDASPKFFNFFNSMYRLGLWSWPKTPVQILLPLSGKSKVDVVKLGLELGVPFEHTWSCYWDRDMHCGTCASCLERKEAFRGLGLKDPIAYESVAGASGL
ncbi:MAG TPA: 7-cyano-7-deazaguanine synthase [Thermoplasmata archaeon]